MLPRPPRPRARRIVALALLAVFGAPSHGGSQGLASKRTSTMLFRATVHEFANHNRIPVGKVMVDTSYSGRVRSTAPYEQRQRLLSPRDMKDAARKSGFALASTSQIRSCLDLVVSGEQRVPCEHPQAVASVVVHAPHVMGDSAVIHTRYVLLRPRQPSEGGMMYFVFEQRGAAWALRRAVTTALGSRGR